MIADNFQSIKERRERLVSHLERLLAPAIVMAVAIAAFGLGRISVLEEKLPQGKLLQARVPPIAQTQAGASSTVSKDGQSSSTKNKPIEKQSEPRNFVASKNGTKYYPVGCKWGNRIKDANRIWFASAKEAEAAGYEASARCK